MVKKKDPVFVACKGDWGSVYGFGLRRTEIKTNH